MRRRGSCRWAAASACRRDSGRLFGILILLLGDGYQTETQAYAEGVRHAVYVFHRAVVVRQLVYQHVLAVVHSPGQVGYVPSLPGQLLVYEF